MWMIFVTLCSAISIASTAAYFSIVGLATLFSAAFWPVVIMATVLECGKLVATSWVYQSWDYSPKIIRFLLVGIIGVLMLITSMGIFGLLSKGYLEAKSPATQQTIEIQSLKSDVGLIRERIAAIEEEDGFYRLELGDLQSQIDNYPQNYATKRIQTYKAQKPRRDEIAKSLEENRNHKAEQLKLLRQKNSELNTLERDLVEIEGELGPIKYVGRLLGVLPDEGVQYVILAIIFAFDPLAVLLMLAANISIVNKYGRESKAAKIVRGNSNLPEPKEEAQKSSSSELPPMKEFPVSVGKTKPIKDLVLEEEKLPDVPEELPEKKATSKNLQPGRPSNPNWGRKTFRKD